jgi:excisionase family DNA binding protein
MASSTIRSMDDLPVILTMEDIRQALGLSRQKTYQLPHMKGFPAIKFGRAIRIPRDAFLKWLESQAGVGGDK